MHCTRAYSIFYFSFHSDCLFQRRRRDPTSRQRKVYCILCLLSYCFFVRNFNNWEPARIFQMRRRLFFTSRRPRVCCIFFCSFHVYFNAADAILHRDSATCVASSVFFLVAFLSCAPNLVSSRVILLGATQKPRLNVCAYSRLFSTLRLQEFCEGLVVSKRVGVRRLLF